MRKKDFISRLKISRKEAKESVFWLRLIISTNDLDNVELAKYFLQEAIELKKIFSRKLKTLNPEL